MNRNYPISQSESQTRPTPLSISLGSPRRQQGSWSAAPLWLIGPVSDHWDWPISETPDWSSGKADKVSCAQQGQPGQSVWRRLSCIQVTHKPQSPGTQCVREARTRASTRTHADATYIFQMVSRLIWFCLSCYVTLVLILWYVQVYFVVLFL